MAKNHGAKQQKKLAKQKAKRQEKRLSLMKRDSVDPTIRLQRAERWPVVRALMTENLWDSGLGYLVIARREGEGRLVFATFLVDVFCLGVKDAFWRAGSKLEFDELVERMESSQPLVPIKPECLVRILQGADDYAQSFGFRPHRDFKHVSLLLQGIDAAGCAEEFTYGKDGKPFYVSGPHDTPEAIQFIVQRVQAAGGHFLAGLAGPGPGLGLGPDDFIDDEEFEENNDIIVDIPTETEGLSAPASTES